ncbi:MAG TPA: HAMP domain-containing sensor histidine kinase [Kofleriaceae bacterium]|nr:HAMP domain-containing sensor histidine kinase [Kofleriaceae bacterium]
MGELIRHTDWSRTELGAAATWPQSLRTAVSIALESRVAMAVAWGPRLRLFYNDRYRPMIGDMLGRPAAEAFAEIWHTLGPAFDCVRRGESVAIEDGRFTVSCSPIRDESGGVGGVLAIATENAARELALRAAQAELARTLQYNEMFAGVLGHELRNPLNAILAAAQLLERRTSAPELTRPLRRIINSGERMTRMISQLLDFTRVRVGRGLELEPAAADLGEIGARAVDELRTAHPDAPLELRAHGDLRGHWDAERIAQVVTNLVGNAIDHGEPSAPVAVTLCGDDPAAVRLTVENRGTVPDHLIPALFDPFGAARHRGGKSSGLGLGLYISREIIASHGGEVSAACDGERRTRIEVRLPRGDGGGRP